VARALRSEINLFVGFGSIRTI